MLDGDTVLSKTLKTKELPVSIIPGSKGQGLPAAFHQVGTSVTIPHNDEIDSRNLSAAAGIAMYHFSTIKEP